MGKLRANILLLVVFVTGAAVLVLEVVATRILAPYFGNTIYTVSSVLGVFLAALSFGYYFGGGLADRRPSNRWFYAIIAASGVCTLFTDLLCARFLPALGRSFSMVEGPPVVSIILFIVPAFLLGMLSPYAIKLQERNRPDEGIGRLAGQIFFSSTFGSIFGSIFAGFYLIPSFGVSSIILGTGVILVCLGLSGLVLSGGNTGLAGLLAVAGIALTIPALSPAAGREPGSLFVHDGLYERLEVFEREENGRIVRILKQNMSDSGGVYLGSDEHVSEYSKYYKLYEIFAPKLERAVAIGGGPYTVPRVLLREDPRVRVDAVEIEPILYELAKRYFELPDDPRLANFVQDGRRFLMETDALYDLMFLDVYLESVPVHFTTKEFFELAKQRLAPGGLFLANFIGSLSRGKPSLLLSEIRTFRSVFPNSYFVAANSPKSFNVQNIVIVGHNSGERIDLDAESIARHPDPVIRDLKSRIIDLDRYNLDEHLLLSDDYAPVEHMTAKLFFNTIPAPAADPAGPRRIHAGAAGSTLRQQLSYGPRKSGSPGHERVRKMIEAEMRTLAGNATLMPIQGGGSNVFARFREELPERLLLAAGYDPGDSPGACSTAAAVAVMFEVARYLSSSPETPRFGVDLAFLDGRTSSGSNGATDLAGRVGEIYGDTQPRLVAVLDVVGNAELTLRMEESSAASAGEEMLELWKAGQSLTKSFLSERAPAIRGDHTVFQKAGLESILVSDGGYGHAHGPADTAERCSDVSLDKVGSALVNYIYGL